MTAGPRSARAAGAIAIPLLLGLTACGGSATRAAVTGSSLPEPMVSASAAPAVPPPTAVRPALLINQSQPFSPRNVQRVRRLDAVSRLALIGYGQVWVYGDPIPTATVDPATYRSFTPAGTSGAIAVWKALADGKAVVSHVVGERDHLPLDAMVPAGWSSVRIAGLATTVPGIDMVVSASTGERIGVPFGNGLVVAVTGDPDQATARIRGVLGATPVIRRIARPGETLSTSAVPRLPAVTPSAPARTQG
jgi:hypothetical protein